MTSAIVVAAGTSQRMGFDKLTAILAGCPVFIRTLQRFEICSDVKEIILVVHPDRLKPFGALVADFGLSKVNRVVAGGEQRHLSVAAGLQATSPTGRLGCGSRRCATAHFSTFNLAGHSGSSRVWRGLGGGANRRDAKAGGRRTASSRERGKGRFVDDANSTSLSARMADSSV